MKAKLMMQSENENNIANSLIELSESKPKKAYFFIGNFKESGFEILENCLIDLKAKKLFVIGVDKKNTTKKMLEGLYKYTKNVFVYNNNEFVELDGNVIVFEYEKTSIIYVLSGNCSKGGLEDNMSIYTVLEYNLENSQDKIDYAEYIEQLIKITKMDIVRKLDKEYILELINSKAIFSNKQYSHNIMSIAELAAQSKNKQKENASKQIVEQKSASDAVEIDENKESIKDNIYDEEAKLNIANKLDLVDMSFDIDMGDAEESIVQRDEKFEEKEYIEPVKEKKTSVKKEKENKTNKKTSKKNEEDEFEYDDKDIKFDPNSTLDLENILFEKSKVKLDTRKIDKKEQEERKLQKNKKQEAKELAPVNKKIDLNKVSNIVMETPKKPSKGKDIVSIKIPNYIREMIPNFFEIMDSSIAVNKKDGLYKEAEISVEIVDTVKNKKYTDVSANLSCKFGQTYIAFVSDMMKNVEYEENDIIRLIKLSREVYHIEIISKDSQEYKVWKKMCTQKFRGADRQYGVM